MGSVPPLLTFLLMMVSGWVHRRQLMVIEFLQAENLTCPLKRYQSEVRKVLVARLNDLLFGCSC
jgi:hypothetical protein